MLIPDEVLLAVGAVGFYVVDSIVFLRVNEFVFLRSRNRWKYVWPSSNWTLLGRALYVPNPLRPDVAAFRVFWTDSALDGGSNDEVVARLLTAIRNLRYLIQLLLLIFALFIAALISHHARIELLLILLGVFYFDIFLILLFIYLRSEILGVSTKSCVQLSFEAIVCPPLALNLLRKVTLNFEVSGDPIDFAARSFDAHVIQKLLAKMLDKVDEKLLLSDATSDDISQLESYRTKLEEMRNAA